ncbi:hypothetical protein HELRODRAFT_165919 [Helobdella robusta]|uniref:Uncharacterized protein n=1 Tax=Helobdella robusta TaxID=6412 RepID=T1EXG4_HELRO|nr:hypothetical protein HELRODRAFT_165919 [Helobdella robusta]ESN90276.1 hypothetical protein HELRODRAFT_165919 [Helobdella robusta]
MELTYEKLLKNLVAEKLKLQIFVKIKNHEQFEVQDDEEEEEAPVQGVSTKMALQCARKLTSYLIHMGNRELLQFSENIENILEIELLKTKCFGKQTTMNDFLP